MSGDHAVSYLCEYSVSDQATDMAATAQALTMYRHSSAVRETRARDACRFAGKSDACPLLIRTRKSGADCRRREQERLEKAEQARRETERILREQRAAVDAKEVRCLSCTHA